ncbi:MAG: hypothetical protein H6669_01485 [Ardenticatenaceae bacterium]|nr:hypothetical protein [Ardenticatenaceae bacterium]
MNRYVRLQHTAAEVGATALDAGRVASLQKLKSSAYLDTGDMVPANRLYEAAGFTEAYKGCVWRKLF